MDIISSIKSKYDRLSKSEKRVADFVINNINKIETDTISKVASESGTSTSAVLRFCKSIGFQGYKEFRFELTQYYRSLSRMTGKKTTENLLSNYLEVYSQSISKMFELDYKLLKNLATAILKGRKVFIAGIYQSGIPAKYLSNALQDFEIDSRVAVDINDAAHMAKLISEKDVLIYFSVSGDKLNFSKALGELMDSMPTESYVITYNRNSALSQLFRHTLVLPGQSVIKHSVLDPQSLAMLFIEILIQVIHEKLLDT